MKKLTTLEELFHHQLKDIYSAECQICKVLPEIIEYAYNKKLKKALSDHMEETEDHIRRLEEISKEKYLDLKGEACEAMSGLIKEVKSFISKGAEVNVRDTGIIADVQQIERYEISAYGMVIEHAKALGEKEIAKKLEKSLKEELQADKILRQLGKESVHVKV